MSDNKNAISSTKNKLWTIISSIIKSIILLIIIGIIMYALSYWLSEEIYRKNSSNFHYNCAWNYNETLDPVYGVAGIIIYIAINYFSCLLYNYITNKFKNYKVIIGKVIYIIFSFLINIVMLILYWKSFGTYSFENSLLDFFNIIIIRYGYIIFPIIFAIIFLVKIKKHSCNCIKKE